MMEKAEVLDELRTVFPTIINRCYSDKQVDKETGEPKELKPEIIEFNPGSHAQVYSRLNERYDGAFVTPVTDAGNPQCDSVILEKYAASMPGNAR